MNLKLSQRKFAVPVIAGAAALLAAAFSATAQPTNGTDFASFQVISQRNIFDPNRVAHSHFNSTRAAARIADSFSFLGTMSYEKGNFAFFDGTSPDFRKVLELDGDIAGFKVTALAPKSVTLLSGTNEMVLPVGTQVRRDDDGHWAVSTEPASYSNAGNSYATSAGRHRRRQDGSGRSNLSTISTTTADNSQPDDSNTTDSGTDTNAPDASALSVGGANDALTRLMQQRAQEEQQLGQGQ
jgi:hypothetical protein